MRMWVILLTLWGTLLPAAAETLTVSLSHHRVRITSTYTGAELVVFGVIDRDAASAARAGEYDLVVTARGPRGNTVVREKQRLGPIWINREQVKFFDLPSTMAVLSTGPLSEIADPEVLRRFRIGLSTAGAENHDASSAPGRTEEFAASLVRLKTRAGLYVEDDRGIAFLTESVFRAGVPVPAAAPIGIYDVEVALFRGGVRLAVTTTNFEVSKDGIEQMLALEARENGLLYGLTAAAMALAFGWLATVVFRRD